MRLLTAYREGQRFGMKCLEVGSQNITSIWWCCPKTKKNGIDCPHSKECDEYNEKSFKRTLRGIALRYGRGIGIRECVFPGARRR